MQATRQKYREANRSELRSKRRRYRETPEGRAVLLIQSARARAGKKGVPFDPALRSFVAAAIAGGLCSVTGIPFVLDSTGDSAVKHPLAPSIDRIDSSKGYTADNVRVVCWAVNAACSTWGLDATLAIFSRALGISNPTTDAVLARLQETP